MNFHEVFIVFNNIQAHDFLKGCKMLYTADQVKNELFIILRAGNETFTPCCVRNKDSIPYPSGGKHFKNMFKMFS